MESKEDNKIEPVETQPQQPLKALPTETVAETHTNSSPDIDALSTEEHEEKKPWWHSIKEPGSALQIIIAAIFAIGIGLAVSTTVDEVPESARVILSIPGDLWLRSLKAVGKCHQWIYTERH
jgi:hypothetical protein